MNIIQIINQAKQSIKLSLPIILSELTSSIGGFIGTLMIARVSYDSLAALALVNTTFITLIASCWGVIMSVGVLVSHSYGAKQLDTVEHTVGQGFWLAGLLSVPIILIFNFASPLFLVLGQDPKTVALAQAFFTPVSVGIFPALCAGVLQQCVLAFKHSRAVMICSIASVLLSIPVNYILIFGKVGFPALGIAGIGWTTTIVHCFMLLFMCVYILITKEFRQFAFFSSIFRVDKQRLMELLSIGWPIGGMLGVEICGLFAAVILCGWLGNLSLAAYQIALQCMITAIMIPWGMGQGTTVLVGHAIGAGDMIRAKQAGYVGMLLSSIPTLFIALIFWFMPQLVVRLFIGSYGNDNLPITNLAIPMLGVLGWVIIFDGVRINATGALRGLKDTRFALLMGVVSFWIMGLPIGYLLAFTFHKGAVGLWIGDFIGVLCGTFLLIFRFYTLIKSNEHIRQT